VTPLEATLLQTLADEHDGATVDQLAAALPVEVSPPTVTRALDSLRVEGHVKMAKPVRNPRRIGQDLPAAYALTATGRAMVQR
jgi:predicted ArsR family transcriptional regulator